jgi:hypothetical protein
VLPFRIAVFVASVSRADFPGLADGIFELCSLKSVLNATAIVQWPVRKYTQRVHADRKRQSQIKWGKEEKWSTA